MKDILAEGGLRLREDGRHAVGGSEDRWLPHGRHATLASSVRKHSVQLVLARPHV